MIEKELEMVIKQQFDMNLCQFIKNKVENEKLYDYEIARILNVSGRVIARLRNLCKTRKGNAFTRRFERAYGPGAVEMFKEMIENPENSLSHVARHFRFSREYARQVCKKIYGYPYAEVYERKRKAREEKKLVRRMESSRQLGALMKAKEKMRSMGISSDLTNEGRKYMLLTNGQKLILKSSSKPTRIGRKQYFRIHYSALSSMDCDFLICLCGDKEEGIFYVIPKGAMPRRTISLLPHAGDNESKYTRFKEAWHLLKSGIDERKAAKAAIG